MLPTGGAFQDGDSRQKLKMAIPAKSGATDFPRWRFPPKITDDDGRFPRWRLPPKVNFPRWRSPPKVAPLTFQDGGSRQKLKMATAAFQDGGPRQKKAVSIV